MNSNTLLRQLVALNENVRNVKSAREQMLTAAQALVASLQTPSEFISCIGWAEPARFACVRIALDLKIFDILKQRDGGEGTTSTQLAGATGADRGLIERMMKHLVATNVLEEKSVDRFANTPLSRQLTEPKYHGGIMYTHDVSGPAFHAMPKYLSETHYKQPHDSFNSPFQLGHNTKLHFYPWFAKHPTQFKAFTSYMSGYRDGRCTWFSPKFYPVQERLIDGFRADGDKPFIVDVGGGKGHDLIALQSHFLNLPGRLVLQDTPTVIESINPPLPSTIEAMSHDFFTPQPVAGARAYFMHSIFHNWDDETCIKILKNLKSALTPGYSKILIHDFIIPEKGASWKATGLDLMMMAIMAVRERTEADFRKLFEAAGLTVENVWVYAQDTEGIIEASLAPEKRVRPARPSL